MPTYRQILNKYRNQLSESELKALRKEAEAHDGYKAQLQNMAAYIEDVYLKDLDEEEKDIRQQIGEENAV